jgi:hypothetical protein
VQVKALAVACPDSACRAVAACATFPPFLQDGKPATEDLKEYGMACHELGPGLLDAFNMDFGNKLWDEAGRALRRNKKAGSDQANGFHVEENGWMQVFSEVGRCVCVVGCCVYHLLLFSRFNGAG